VAGEIRTHGEQRDQIWPIVPQEQGIYMGQSILVLNAGSSSLKFALFAEEPPFARALSGSIDRIASGRSRFAIKSHSKSEPQCVDVEGANHISALDSIMQRIEKENIRPRAIGHRIVHGGDRYDIPARVDGAMIAELRRIRSFDPEHLPAEIAIIERIREKFPDMEQIACFDTAFHKTMPRVAQLLPIPRRLQEKGLRRYGFHGLSYEFLMEELGRIAGPNAAKGRVILAHLGNGASMAAVRGGKCMDTSMAFTPAAGLVMSTRSGNIDPGVASFLMKQENLTAAQFDRMMNHESGLLGVSETSSDMRDLLAREAEDHRAAEAVELFCHEAKKFIGAYAAVLGGLDTLVFAGGIGEHASPVRTRICAGLSFLGIDVDQGRNEANAEVISTDNSRTTVRVIRTDEELMIAQAVLRILGKHGVETSGEGK
jgi:acetate kinase